ncbi:MAG: bifunctional diguanylate cyclase/phosphodiesterase [Lachnospiraceae bacterium]|nr:bifunctional diguanylate cyclase/phosphodiesterase [Lachnospiraceae bacterium]
MDHKDLRLYDEISQTIYIADRENYDLVFLNRCGRQRLGIQNDQEVYGKCYKVLQGLDAPCSFCNNKDLKENEVYSWKYWNEKLKTEFLINDSLIWLWDKWYRMEIAVDILEIEEGYTKAKDDLHAAQVVVQCVKRLTSLDDSIQEAVEYVLARILEYYHGSRSYILEIDPECQCIRNTYEVCGEGMVPKKDALQQVSLLLLTRWAEYFERAKYIHIEDREAIKESSHRQIEYQIMVTQDAQSLLAVPFYINGKIQGILGVSDPACRKEDTQFLLNLTYFVLNEISRRKMSEQLTRLSYHDLLTNLNNRNRYNETIARFEQEEMKNVGAAFIDMNGLKSINDTYGHSVGDRAIRNLADILIQCFKAKEVYRISGDEFVVIQEKCTKSEFTKRVQHFQKCIQKDDGELATVGYVWRSDRCNLPQMLNDAEQIMYAGKQSYYEKHSRRGAKQHPAMLGNLIRELEQDVYTVYFQPQMNVKSGRIERIEALVRKIDEDGNVVNPFDFIPILENASIISKIDFFVLENVCRKLKQWKEKGYPVMHVSINVSRVTLAEDGFVARILEICDHYQTDRSCLEFEITESSRTLQEKRMLEVVRSLKREGFSIALDDMGAEYGSLELIMMKEVSIVKLDRSFVQRLQFTETEEIFLSGLINTCHRLGKVCVAEGVENEQQRLLLERMGCEYIQGYWLDKPMQMEAFEEKYLKI